MDRRSQTAGVHLLLTRYRQMATYMHTHSTSGASRTNVQRSRKRSIGALIAGISLATALTAGSGLTGLLPFLSAKADAATTLKGLVYVDLNLNGVRDVTADVVTNEFGRGGVSVVAYGKDGAQAGSATTLADGTWQIVTDAQGPFRVEFSNYSSTQIASGNNLGGTSVQFPNGSTPVNFSLFGKVNGLGELEEIAFKPLQIGNRVWLDANRNGIQDPEESGIPGVLVKLVDEAGEPAVNINTGAVLPDVVTNGSGEYYFSNIGGGRTYRVVIDPAQPALSGYSLTTAFATANGGNTLNDSNGFYVASGDTETFLVPKPIAVGSIVARVVTGGPGQNDHSFDFGLVPTITTPKYSLGDFVFVDVNRNGIQDSGDVPVAGATVTLLDANGTPIAGKSVQTGADGLYKFDGLEAGTYRVRVTRPAGSDVTPTSANTGTNDDVDSDIVGDSPDSAVTGPITVNSNVTNVDAGWVTPVSSPKYVLGDRVFLDVNRNGVQDAGDLNVAGATVELLDGNGAPIAGKSVQTGADGLYLFTDLDAGSYRVRVTRPAGADVSPTTANVGTDDAVDSDFTADTANRVISGVINLTTDDRTVDAGWVTPTTSATGKIGDRLFIDTNRNGIQDPTEPGIQGVNVTLQTCTGEDRFTLPTVQNGGYEFSQLPAGSYRIKFALPADYEFTTRAVGNDRAVDSNVDAAGITECVTIGEGETNLTIDAGVVAKTTNTTTTTPNTTTTTPNTTTTAPTTRTAKIGDRVFFDANRNGIQDRDEVGYVGARVYLETCAGAQLASTVTIADGRYEFANLAAGQYRVRFDTPFGYQLTAPFIGGDSGLDSDAEGGAGTTRCVTLAAGETNATIDAGIYQNTIIVLDPPTTTRPATTVPPTTAPATTVLVSTGCIGDKVFEGKAGDRDGKGIAGISLILVMEDGSAITTVTDTNGLYRFCTLKPGTYTVRITVPPAGATNIYTLDGKKNNATAVTLAGGKDNLDADFGYDLGKAQVLPTVVEQGPDFPETPVITPSVTGSNGTRQGLGGLALILTGIGMVGLIRSRKEHWN